MKEWLFWIVWGIDAFICAVIVVFFFLGMMEGSVSSYNIGIWLGILVALIIILGGSSWLKMCGYSVLATILLLVLAVPDFLYGLFILLVVLTKTSWN